MSRPLACAWLLVLAFTRPLLAQDADADAALAQRCAQIGALIAPAPSVPTDAFEPAFLQAVPVPKIVALCAGIHAQGGAVRGTSLVERSSEWQARYDVDLERGFGMSLTMVLSSAPPHRVSGLWFGALAPALPSLDAVAKAIGELPGQTTFLVARLGDGPPQPVAAHAPEHPCALGSAFKLWILARLASDVRAGTRRWDEVVPLRAAWRSLPSGRMQDWPDGAPVTLHTLATAMISESDNTATDHLLHTLGRERIEQLLPSLGVSDATARAPGALDPNRPLLGTAELFRLKLSAGDEAATVWLTLATEAARRRYLEQDVPELPLSGAGTDPGAFATPQHVDTIEWFASAADLVRTLDALRHLAEPVADASAARDAAPLLGVLSVNPGLPVAREAFDWAGYKGGSETGVLSLNWLLRARDGHWYALACASNDPGAPVDEARLTGLLSRALTLLGRLADAAPAAAETR